jgi:plastocyanin
MRPDRPLAALNLNPQRPRIDTPHRRLLAGSCLVALAIACGGGDGAEAPPSADSPQADAPPAAPAEPLGTATVTGAVSFEGEAPAGRPIAMGADPKCEAKHDGPVANQAVMVGDDGALGNVLVRVLWTGGPVGAPTEPKVIDQRGCLYTPRVVGVQIGQTLEILNSDELLHNVHSTSSVNPPFNRAMPAAITETEVTFQQPEEPFLVKCDVHPWMASYVAVLDHPFYAVSGADGSF